MQVHHLQVKLEAAVFRNLVVGQGAGSSLAAPLLVLSLLRQSLGVTEDASRINMHVQGS